MASLAANGRRECCGRHPCAPPDSDWAFMRETQVGCRKLLTHWCICCPQEAGLLPDNLLGNHRTWLGFAKDNYGTAADNAQSGYNTASAKAKAGYQKAKATIKDKAPEF